MRPKDLDVEHRYELVNGLRMHLALKGQGPLVVLLHGFPENWWSWRYQIEPLARAGFRVVAPDLRGYNQTERRGPYDVDTLAADVRALIERLGEKHAYVVGHDWGGAVAWHFAATHPDACARLAVMNAPHLAVFRKALLTRPAQLAKSWYMLFFQLPWLPEWMLTRNGAEGILRTLQSMAVDPTNFSREELQPLLDGAREPGAMTAMLNYYRANVPRGVSNPGRFASYPKIGAPTLLLWAMDDKSLGHDELVPPTHEWVSDLRVVRIERCGHFVQQEKPEAVNPPLVAFLREGAA